MKKLFLVATFIITVAFVHAQDYSNAIGFRGGLSNGITGKHFLGNNSAVEGILATRWNGLNVTALYELHKFNMFDTERLNLYYGAGAHIGFWNGAEVKWVDDSATYVVLGIDGIVGLEYNFTEVPLNVSIDYKPAFNLIGVTGFWGDEFALSLRYIF